jgi:hypothetical protein
MGVAMEWALGSPPPPSDFFPFDWLTFIGAVGAGLVAIWWTGAKLFVAVRHPLVRRAARSARPTPRTLAILAWGALALVLMFAVLGLLLILGVVNLVTIWIPLVVEVLWLSLGEKVLPSRRSAPLRK